MSAKHESRQSAQQTSSEGRRESEYNMNVPPQIVQQAEDAAAAASTTEGYQDELPDLTAGPSIEDVPPPPYSAEQYGEIDISEKGMDTGARVARDGRVDIKISSKNRQLTSLLKRHLDISQDEPAPEPEIPEGLGMVSGLPPPPMNIVIQIVGSRGDVQPFVALGLVLKDKFNHRVRIATHPVFKDFIIENGLEFFSIGGDPAELMAFMVKNPGLMPGIEAIRSGDIGKRRRGIYEMINGCWRSCIEPGDGTGIPASDDRLDGRSVDSGISSGDPSQRPFVADAIIANPPSFAHIHIAEKLGVPLHLMFTMPWSPTQSFPHPLANIVSSNADAGMTNFLSYILVDLLTWQGIGDVINRFREKTLRLEPLSVIWAPGNLHRMKIPWTYCWSPALIPKPGDWMTNIDISGFYFLNLATNYVPPPDLEEFLNAGPPPVYIGFGSIVVDDPNAMTKLIFEAVQKTGQRALVSKGWGGLSGDEMGVPEGIFMLGNCPHDWLFKKVSCVVHHGGAGTTAAGIAAGRPTIIVPFFGDQQFWGAMCHRAGAGPAPIPHKELTAANLAEAIEVALKPETLDRAKEMSDRIKQEQGTDSGAESFHRHLTISKMRCSLCPGRVAVWQYKKGGIRLSALAATVLANEKLLEFSDLRLYRSREYVPDTGPPEPISGGAAALIGTLGSVSAGVADYPSEILKSFKKGSSKPQDGQSGTPGPSKSPNTKPGSSTSSLTTVPELTGPSESSLHQRNQAERSPSQTSLPGRHLSQRTVDSDVSELNPSGATRSESGFSDTTMSDASPSEMPSMSSATSIVVTDTDKEVAPNSSNDSTSTLPIASDADSRQSGGSIMSSTSASRSRTPTGRERSASFNRAGQISMDSMIGTARATGNIVVAGMKSPLDFTMSIAQGFHNAPKLYGDKTVRPTERVTGIQSGLKAAGKEFGYGMFDGIAGLVTQPIQGAKEEGLIGLGKGLFKGSMGVWLKPGAAIWGLPGYAMKGIYAEIIKNIGRSTVNFIIAARTAQGYEDWKNSSEGERERIVAAWKAEVTQAKVKSSRREDKSKANQTKDQRFYGDDGQLLSGWRATRHLSIDDRKKLDTLRQEAKQKQMSKGKQTSNSAGNLSSEGIAGLSNASEAEFEEAIRTAVQETSTNNADEDARIERAIRASVREFRQKLSQKPPQAVRDEGSDDAYDHAVVASIAEYERPTSRAVRSDTDVIETTLNNQDDDEEFTRALQASLVESRRPEPRTAGIGSDTEDDEEYRTALADSKNAAETRHRHDDDEDYRRAIEESKHTHASRSQPLQASSALLMANEAPPGYEASAEVASGSAHAAQAHNTAAAPAVPPRSPLRRPARTNDDDDDEDFQRTLKASEHEAKQRDAELQKQRTEEDVVLEYVKKQSLAEEEYRRKMQGRG